jgi:hypothetical protein
MKIFFLNPYRFSENLVLTDKNKFTIKSTDPYYLFKQLFDAIHTSASHNEALMSLDLIQILLLVDIEKNSKYLKDISWYQAINRFSSNKTKDFYRPAIIFEDLFNAS